MACTILCRDYDYDLFSARDSSSELYGFVVTRGRVCLCKGSEDAVQWPQVSSASFGLRLLHLGTYVQESPTPSNSVGIFSLSCPTLRMARCCLQNGAGWL